MTESTCPKLHLAFVYKFYLIVLIENKTNYTLPLKLENMNEITTPLSTKQINSIFMQSSFPQQQHHQQQLLMAAKKPVDPSLMALLKDIKDKHQNIKYKSYRLAAELTELKRIFGSKQNTFF